MSRPERGKLSLQKKTVSLETEDGKGIYKCTNVVIAWINT